MTKKQTRKSISVRGTTYAKVKAYADKMGRSVSDVAETALTVLMNSGPAMDSIVAKMGEVPFTDLARVARETQARTFMMDKSVAPPHRVVRQVQVDKVLADRARAAAALRNDAEDRATHNAIAKNLGVPLAAPRTIESKSIKPLDPATIRTVAQDIARRRAARPESSAANVPDRAPSANGKVDHRNVKF